MSLVTRVAASASVRAMSTVGTSSTSGAGRAVGPGGHAEPAGGEPRCGQCADEVRGRDQDLAAEVSALLLGAELVLEVHAGGAALDHRGHELERVERTAEARLGVGDDRRKEVRLAAVGPRDLVGPSQGVV